jgi:hypothetical protein
MAIPAGPDPGPRSLRSVQGRHLPDSQDHEGNTTLLTAGWPTSGLGLKQTRKTSIKQLFTLNYTLVPTQLHTKYTQVIHHN